jgi:hypothetical protein
MGSGGIAPRIFSLAIRWSSAACLGLFTPGKKATGRARLLCDVTCAEDSFLVSAERTSAYSFTANVRDRQFISLLVAGVCLGMACSWITLHCPVSPSLPLLRAGLCRHIVIELHPLDRRVGEPQSPVGRYGEEAIVKLLSILFTNFMQKCT